MANDHAPIDCQDFQGVILELTISAQAGLAIKQAIQFAMEHEKEFRKHYPCDDCWERLKGGDAYFDDIVMETAKGIRLRKGGQSAN